MAEGKETKVFDGREYLLERSVVGDFSLVAAWKGDRLGNLVYRKSARNFNPMAVTAGRIAIAEVEELVESARSTRSASTRPASSSTASSSRPVRSASSGGR